MSTESDTQRYQIVQLNLTTLDELQTISDALRQWGANQDAFMAEAWAEAVAWRG